MFWLDLATKQEAFEESIRLKNQFRTLDEDEVEFLDSVLESTRAKEEAVKKETTEHLELFRRQQEEADKAALREADTETGASREAGSPSDPPSAESQWAINARKRKRTKDGEAIPGLKLRKSSSASKEPSAVPYEAKAALPGKAPSEVHRPRQTTGDPSYTNVPSTSINKSFGNTHIPPPSTSAKPSVSSLGLAAYSSDEED